MRRCWIETGMIGAIGRGIQGKRRWMGRMMLGPVWLKTGTGQQFGSHSYTMFTGFNGSGSCRVQGGNLLGSSFVRRSFLSRRRTSDQRRWRPVLRTGTGFLFLRCWARLLSQVPQGGSETPAILLPARSRSRGVTLR